MTHYRRLIIGMRKQFESFKTGYLIWKYQGIPLIASIYVYRNIIHRHAAWKVSNSQ